MKKNKLFFLLALFLSLTNYSYSQGYTNLLSNPGFETGTADWTAVASNISTANTGSHSGSSHGNITSRTADWGGPNQNVLSSISSIGGGMYYLEAWIKLASGTGTGYVNLKLTINGVTTTYSVSQTISSNWTKVSGNITIPTWSEGLLTLAEVFVTTESTADFSIDDCIFKAVVPVAPVPANLLTNPGFENSTTKWANVACSLTAQSGSGQHSGSYLCNVSGRTYDWGGPNQSVTSLLAPVGGGKYYLEAWVKTASGTVNGYANLKVTVAGVIKTYTVTNSAVGTSWTKISGVIDVENWEAGKMTNAEFFVTTSGTGQFFADDLLLQCQNATPPINASGVDAYVPDANPIKNIPGWSYAWGDEFNYTGSPDENIWNFETGFLRGNELKYYQKENANVADGRLLITGKKETVLNERYDPSSNDYRYNTQYSEYTSASLTGKKKKYFLYGRIEVRAKINPANGAFPAIWTCGVNKNWPKNGEIDIMEYYLANMGSGKVPVLTSNFCVGGNPSGSDGEWAQNWKSVFTEQSYYENTYNDPDWINKYHIYRMDWDEDKVSLYVDDELRNTIDINTFKNYDGSVTFNNPQFMILNLAIKDHGNGVADNHQFEVDYFRVYQKTVDLEKPTAVSGLNATNVTPSSCTVNWSAATDNVAVLRYDVYRNGDADGYFLGSATGTSFNVSGLQPGANKIVVKALDANGNYSDNAEVTVNVLPAAPTSGKALGWDKKIDLSWKKTDGATSYKIKRAATAGGPYTEVGTSSQCKFSDNNNGNMLTNGTTYYYVVSALSGGEESANSTEFSAVPFNTSAYNNWEHTDIGSTGLVGNAGFNGSTLTVYGAGADIWQGADAFHFLYMPMSGDMAIVAKVLDIENTHPGAKAGVMIREKLTGQGRHAMAVYKPGFTAEFGNKTTEGGDTGYPTVSTGSGFQWVKLVRSGDVITSYYSADGLSWTQGPATSISGLANEVYVGLVALSHDVNVLTKTEYDAVSVATALPLVNSNTADGQQGSSFNYTVSASNQPYSFAATGLPSGLNINEKTGVISGTPTQEGQYNVSLKVLNAIGETASTLTINVENALPVVLQQYSAHLQANGNVLLNWSVASEIDNDYFTVERRQLSGNFAPIAKIASKGSNAQQYNFQDHQASAGINYYRLSQTDKNGKTKELGVKWVDVDVAKQSSLVVYPQPVSENEFSFSYVTATPSLAVSITDLSGKIIYKDKLATKANQHYKVVLGQKLPTGMYILSVDHVKQKLLIK